MMLELDHNIWVSEIQDLRGRQFQASNQILVLFPYRSLHLKYHSQASWINFWWFWSLSIFILCTQFFYDLTQFIVLLAWVGLQERSNNPSGFCIHFSTTKKNSTIAFDCIWLASSVASWIIFRDTEGTTEENKLLLWVIRLTFYFGCRRLCSSVGEQIAY